MLVEVDLDLTEAWGHSFAEDNPVEGLLLKILQACLDDTLEVSVPDQLSVLLL